MMPRRRRSSFRWRRSWVPATAVLLGLGWTPPLQGQQDPPDVAAQLRQSQVDLERIKQERAELAQELAQLRSQARNVSGELQNIERQLSASRAVVAEIDFQLEAVAMEVTRITTSLASTREDLTRKKRALGSRLRDVFKRGALNAVRVLLGAESFADLLNRYRYLYLITSLDKSLVERVSLLERSLVQQGSELEAQVAELGRLRDARLEEERSLTSIQQSRQATLADYRQQASAAEGRLSALAADEARISSTIGTLEERRVAAETRTRVAGGPAPAPSSMSSADAGVLDWPVEGPVIYNYGPERRANGTVIRWNGIGIQAAVGTPVRAVRAGLVVLAGPFGGYGPTVVLSHGEGFYTLYLYLEDIAVTEGRAVGEGEVVGTVGGGSTPEGPHLEFQVRTLVNGTTPEATDPLAWLRAR